MRHDPVVRGLGETAAAHEAVLTRLHESRRAFTTELDRRTSALETLPPGTARADQPRRASGKSAQVDRLVQQRAWLDAEIAAHEEILALVQQPGIAEALTRLATDPAALEQAAEDPVAYARGQGVHLPATVVLRVDSDAGRPRVRVLYLDEHAPSSLTWDEHGFRTP